MEQQLKKLQVCAYIIIALLLINTIALFASLKDPNTNTETDTDETGTTYDYDVSMFTTIDEDEFVDTYNGSELSVVYFGRSTCGYCVQFLPVLQQAQSDYGYKTLYVDIEKVSDSTKITNLDSFFESYYGLTPTVVLVKDGKVIDSQVGYTDYSTFASFLEDNGFTK